VSGFKTRHYVITVAEGICGRISLFTDFGVPAFFSRTRLGYTGEWMNPDLPFLLAAQIAAFFIMIFMGFGHPMKILLSLSSLYRLGVDDLTLRNGS